MSNNIEELIRKCLALAQSPNEHEAAAAMAKAQELLLKHNLDMSSILTPTEDDKTESRMINEDVEFEDYKPWQPILLNKISITNFCKIIGVGTQQYHILGRRANVRAVVEMYNWIEPQLYRMIAASGYKRGEKNAYAQGICNTVGKKLNEGLQEYQQQHNCTAMVVNVQREVDGYYKDQYPRTSTRRVSVTSYGAYHDGQASGHNVSIHGSSRQINTGRLLLA